MSPVGMHATNPSFRCGAELPPSQNQPHSLLLPAAQAPIQWDVQHIGKEVDPRTNSFVTRENLDSVLVSPHVLPCCSARTYATWFGCCAVARLLSTCDPGDPGRGAGEEALVVQGRSGRPDAHALMADPLPGCIPC